MPLVNAPRMCTVLVRNSMKVWGDEPDYSHLMWRCAAEGCDSLKDDGITGYASVDMAESAGWRSSRDSQFCPPGRDVAYICPECVEDMKA